MGRSSYNSSCNNGGVRYVYRDETYRGCTVSTREERPYSNGSRRYPRDDRYYSEYTESNYRAPSNTSITATQKLKILLPHDIDHKKIPKDSECRYAVTEGDTTVYVFENPAEPEGHGWSVVYRGSCPVRYQYTNS